MGDENRLFRQFEANLRMTPATVSAVRNRYHAITRRINVDFWGTSSDTDNSWYAGSYGRGTAISTSDIDILVELPPGEYNNAWARSLFGGNGPSALLQKVKRSLSATYPQTKLRGDGQVVVAEFADGVRFEIVPVFRAETPGTYRRSTLRTTPRSTAPASWAWPAPPGTSTSMCWSCWNRRAASS